jgi:hypothetical protein
MSFGAQHQKLQNHVDKHVKQYLLYYIVYNKSSDQYQWLHSFILCGAQNQKH